MYDINTVCKMLGVTSRALRFYEQKGIITSTQQSFSNKRYYNEEQLEQIKKVLVLRSLGLSVRSIGELLNENVDLKSVIIEKRTELSASINTRLKEIELLNETLEQIKAGEDIYLKKEKKNFSKINLEIADFCTDYISSGDLKNCFLCFDDKLKDYLPFLAFEKVYEDTQIPLGKFISKLETVCSENESDSVYGYLLYEKFILVIKYVIRNEKICGLWFSYKERNSIK